MGHMMCMACHPYIPTHWLFVGNILLLSLALQAEMYTAKICAKTIYISTTQVWRAA